MASLTRHLPLLLLLACEEDRGAPLSDDIAKRTRSSDGEGSGYSYQNVGRPTLMTWCTPCHNSNLTEEQRSGATLGVDFDDYAATLAWGARIRARVVNEAAPMPPSSGVPDETVERLVDWIDCGMPE